MTLRLLTGARAILFMGPVAIAFFSGGFPAEPRNWAGLVAWLIVALVAAAGPSPMPRSRGARLAIAGIVGLAAWTLLSVLWAPLAGPAYHDAERVWLYAGALIAAAALLRNRAGLRMVEPAVAGGALIVVGYGLSERLAPWLLHFTASHTAFGRLEQPLTYWNAMGLVAALGLVIALRLAGDSTRRGLLRIAAAAACAPLGMGLYVTFSRGALFAYAAGVVVLVVAAPWHSQLRSIVVGVLASVAGAIAAAPFRGVSHLAGSYSSRVTDGTIALVLVAAVALAAAAAQRRLLVRERSRAGTHGRLRLPKDAPLIALGVVLMALAAFVAVGSRERNSVTASAHGASRLTTLESNRYQYWKVATGAFADHPLIGLGASGFAVRWLHDRPFAEGAHDAHSLYVETAAELGLVGLALLACLIVGTVLAARDAHRLASGLAAGPIAGLVAWAAHAAVDWDWEMPAATLPALLLAGVLLALADLRARFSGA
jgi:hypothetical protein